MRQAEIGRAREERGTAWRFVLAAVITLVLIVAMAYVLLARTGGGYSPSEPYGTAAPATGTPATNMPGGTAAPRYP